MVKLGLIMVMNGTRGLLEDLAATYNFSEEDQYRIENAKSDLLSEVKKLDTVTSYVGKPIDYDTACEIANKLLDDKEQLKKEIDELKEKVADQRIDLESSRWYQTVQNEDISKLRGLLRECKEFFEEENPKDFTIMSERMDELLTRINAALGESEEK